MDVKNDYNTWAKTYDSCVNTTRDEEMNIQKGILSGLYFSQVLEIGCGTGKNTLSLLDISSKITAVDFAEAMLEKAKLKVKSNKVTFVNADVTKKWDFINDVYDLVSSSLILEHVSDIDFIFAEVSKVLIKDGFFYIGELHPFKQYHGIKARYETFQGQTTLKSYTHNISEFINCGIKNHFTCERIIEGFDEHLEITIPRIIAFLFRKK